jgi:hypothetical protein
MQPKHVLRMALMALTNPQAKWEITEGGRIRDFTNNPDGSCPLTWYARKPAYHLYDCFSEADSRNTDVNDMINRIVTAADEDSCGALRGLFLRLIAAPKNPREKVENGN